MRYLFQAVLLFFCFQGFSQDSTKIGERQRTRKYIPLNFVQKLGVTLTKQDSLQFKINGNDTLVVLRPGMNIEFPKGTKVEFKPQDSLFLEIYQDVVYGKERYEVQPEQTLRIWKDDVKIYFDKTVPSKHRKELLKFTKRISSEVDSLNIYEVEERAKANYVIYYLEDPENFDLEPRIQSSDGGYYVSWDHRQHLVQGILKINSFNLVSEKNQIVYMKLYFFKSLGVFHESPLLQCESLLSGCSNSSEISEKDLKILKYHYSYQNTIGIDLKGFENYHQENRKILKEHPNSPIYISHRY